MQNSHGSRMEALYQIADRSAEAIEFTVSHNTEAPEHTYQRIKAQKGYPHRRYHAKRKIHYTGSATIISQKATTSSLSFPTR